MSGTSYARKDRFIKEKRHDAYRDILKHTEPATCPTCGATYVQGRWQWLKNEGNASPVICPACRRSADNFPAGEIELKGAFFNAHKEEIVNLVKNIEQQEKQLHPLERIMHIDDEGETIKVATTGIHVARRIGDAIAKAFKGDLSVRYRDEEQHVAIRWER